MDGELMGCALCEMKKITEWRHSDEKVVVCRCSTHRAKWMIVLRRHTMKPTDEELAYMKKVMKQLFGEIKLREPRSIPHYHLHEE